jgi:TonB-linked SusC/RagA family outer membrane protein
MENLMRHKFNKNKWMILTACMFISIFSFGQTTDSDTTEVSAKYNQIKNITLGFQPGGIVTGSISVINGDELMKSFTPNVANTLYGRIPGLTVMQGSGEPGWDSPSFNVRGVNTFGPGRSPFIIIDGFPSTQSCFEQLTPYEIESISLLKDGAATAIFGNRAANGVLMVSTKRGHNGPLMVNFSAQFGFQQAMRLPEFLGSYDYARLYNEGLANDGQPALYTAADLEAYRTGSDPLFYPDVDWHDQVLRDYAPASNYDLNFSGGNETVRYFVLLNVLNSGGLYINTGDLSEFSKNFDYTRYNFRGNMDLKVSNRLSGTIFVGGSVENKVIPGANESTAPEFNLLASVPPNAFPVYVKDNLFGGNQLYTNPLGDILQRGYYSWNARNSQLALKLTEQLDMITPGLSISAAVAFNGFFKSYSIKTREYARYSVSKDESGTPVFMKIGEETSLSGDESRSTFWRNTVIQSFLNYNRQFDIHHIDAMVMYNYDDLNVTGSNLPYRNIGLAGRFTYSMSDKYIGEFSFGYNGSENFPKGKRFGFFPAVSLGWIISNEDFLKMNDAFNYLKIKGSYGLTGNNDIGGTRFMFDQYYNWGPAYYFGTTNSSVSTIIQGPLANREVTWEKEKKFNLGIDASMFKHFDVTLDYFNHDRYDILAYPYRDVPQYLGVNLPLLNVGKVNNKGFETIVRYNNETKSLQYFAEVSVWYAKNKIVTVFPISIMNQWG